MLLVQFLQVPQKLMYLAQGHHDLYTYKFVKLAQPKNPEGLGTGHKYIWVA